MAAKNTGGAKKSTKATSASTKKNTAKKSPAKSTSKKTVAKPVTNTRVTGKSNPNRTQKSAPERLSDIYTASGVRLTIKEAKFIDEYIASGNGSQSVVAAGYKGIPAILANQLLHKLYISEEIQHRMTQHEKDSIASREEIMQFWTDMMRGKILDQFDMPTTNSDKLKAAAELAKRGMDIEDRIREKATSGAPEIKISLDWGGPNGQEE